MADIEEIADTLVNLSIREANELADYLQEEYGIEPAGGAVAVAGAGGEGGEDGEAEEKSEYDVELTSFGDQKIAVIKEVRNLTGLGLKEAKELVDGAPSVIKEAVAAEDAEEMKSSLEEAGAEVTLK